MYDVSISGNTADHSNPLGWKKQAKFGIKVTQADEEGTNQPTGSREGYQTPDAPADRGLYSGRSPENRSFLLTIPPRPANVLILTVPGTQSATEDTLKNITGIAASNPEGDALSATLAVSHGTFTLAATTGLTFSVGDGTADATMTFTGSLTNVNTAIATIAYTPTANYNGSDGLTIDLSDGTTTLNDEITITVGAVNDAPVITVPGSQSLDEDTSKDVTGISIADTDSATITVTNLSVSHGTLTLAQTTGLTFTTGDGTTDAVMAFSGSLANVNAALATLHYIPTANYFGSDSIAIAVSDGGLTDSDSVTLNIADVSDGPELTVPGTLTVNEDSIGGNSVSGVSVTAGDGSAITVVVSASNGSYLRFSGATTGITGSNLASWQSPHTFSGLPTALNTFLSSLLYRPYADFNGSETIDIEITQGVNSDSGSIPVTVTSINDAPVLTVPGFQLVPDFGTSQTRFSITGVTLSDVDHTTVRVRVACDNANVYLDAGSGSYTVTAGTYASPMFEVSATVSDFNNHILPTLGIIPLADFTGEENLTVTVTDSSAGSDSEVIPLYIGPITYEYILLSNMNTRVVPSQNQSVSFDVSGDIGGSFNMPLTSGGTRLTGAQMADTVQTALRTMGYTKIKTVGAGGADVDNPSVQIISTNIISGQLFNSLSYPPTAAFQQPGAQISLAEAVVQQGVGDTTGAQGLVAIQMNSLNIAETVIDIYGNSVSSDESGNWTGSVAGSGWQISGSPSGITTFVSDARMTVTNQFSSPGTGNAQIYLIQAGFPDVTGQQEVHSITPFIAGVGPAVPTSGQFQANSGGMACDYNLDGSLVATNIGTGFGGSSCTGSGNLTSGSITITAIPNGDISDTALSPNPGTAGSGGLMAAEVTVTI